MGVKTPKYFKVLSVADEGGQEHHGILVERIHDSLIITPRWIIFKVVSSSNLNFR
jgi:hypothetical protein